MPNLTQIQNSTWQLDLAQYGNLVEGLDCIRQRIDIVLRTTKGSEPLQPEFGTDIITYVDASVLIAIPAIKAEIIEALKVWLPEIYVISITHKEVNGHVTFYINYGLVDSDIIDTASYSLANNTFSNVAQSKLVLQAVVPENTSNYQYFLQLMLNGTVQPPFANVNGYTTVNELFAFIQASYSYLAEWVLKGNNITGYVKDAQYTTGSIAVSTKRLYKIMQVIPAIVAGESIVLAFAEQTNSPQAPQPIDGFISKGALLSWVQTNLSAYGSWAIENTQGEFNSDFNNDFNIYGNSILVLYTTVYNEATITLTVN